MRGLGKHTMRLEQPVNALTVGHVGRPDVLALADFAITSNPLFRTLPDLLPAKASFGAVGALARMRPPAPAPAHMVDYHPHTRSAYADG